MFFYKKEQPPLHGVFHQCQARNSVPKRNEITEFGTHEMLMMVTMIPVPHAGGKLETKYYDGSMHGDSVAAVLLLLLLLLLLLRWTLEEGECP
jgi:hypothetical protein